MSDALKHVFLKESIFDRKRKREKHVGRFEECLLKEFSFETRQEWVCDMWEKTEE
tara:strand:+ start:641 stop:805 length:165 start_codon:yes stop_codon:yes gene_type:complete